MKFIFTTIDIIGIIFEIYIVITFYNLMLGNKINSFKKRVITYSVYFIALLAGVELYFLKPYIPFIAYTFTFLFAFIYKSRISLKITYSAIIFSMILASEILTGLILTAIFKVNIKTIQTNIFYYFGAIIISKFIIFIIIKVISTFFENKDNSIRTKKITPIIILPLSSAYIIYLLFLTAYNLKNAFITNLTIIGALLLLLANILVIYFIEQISDAEFTKQKLAFAENQLEKQTKYYNEIIENQIKIAKIHHDMKNCLTSLLGYFKTNNFNKAENKIKTFIDDISEPNQAISCSNACIGALLTVKKDRIQAENIKFDFSLNLPTKINIDDIDLCIIIGNALDNAIEACQKIKDNDKNIFFKISNIDEYLSIYIKNSISSVSKLISPKKEKILHGYGILNIKSLCKKYNGNVVFEQHNNYF